MPVFTRAAGAVARAAEKAATPVARPQPRLVALRGPRILCATTYTSHKTGGLVLKTWRAPVRRYVPGSKGASAPVVLRLRKLSTVEEVAAVGADEAAEMVVQSTEKGKKWGSDDVAMEEQDAVEEDDVKSEDGPAVKEEEGEVAVKQEEA